MASKTKAYVVTQSGVSVKVNGDVCAIGDIVQLTDAQAKSRVNKVKLKSEMEAPSDQSKALKTAKNTIVALKADLEKANADNESLNEQLQASNTSVETLNTELSEAKAEIVSLSSDLEEATKADSK